MPAAAFFVDANLLVLFVAGLVDETLIGKHRRLREFSVDDYEKLRNLIAGVERVLVTPNTLTEASNLLGQHGEPERSQLLDGLRYVIEESREIVVASAEAARSRVFHRLGLTDAALFEVATVERPLVTVDLDLYLAASSKDAGAALNFTYLRELG